MDGDGLQMDHSWRRRARGPNSRLYIFNNKKKMLYVEEIKENPLALNKLLTDAGGFFQLVFVNYELNGNGWRLFFSFFFCFFNNETLFVNWSDK